MDKLDLNERNAPSKQLHASYFILKQNENVLLGI